MGRKIVDPWKYEDPYSGEWVVHENRNVVWGIPGRGSFVRAYRAKEVAQKYLDYLYIENGGLSFKVSEESESFADAMTKVPPFYVDEVTRNKLVDLNDVQTLRDYSTFIHQSENPDKVKGCSSFNPLFVDAVLKYGLEQKEIYNRRWDSEGHYLVGYDGVPPLDEDGTEIVLCVDNPSDTTSNRLNSGAIEMDNFTEKTRLKLVLEDGEIDDYLKIYTNYERVDDGHGDWHYDLYFNIQNLFNSPFEYISSVTNQPNVLIIPDSYLYLTGAKFVDRGDHNEIDENKVKMIQQGGELTLYG